MRFGLQLPTYGAAAGPELIAKIAARAEQLGYHSLWVNDHVLVPPSLSRYGQIFEALSTLSWVAASSRHIRLGTSVLILAQRDPILTAKQLATIDVLSGGRLIVGLGAGWVAEEFEFLRAPFAQRGKVMDEQIAVMRALWSGARTFDGEWFKFRDAIFGPLPARGSAIPLWLGGSSEPVLRRTARLGDGWHPAHLSVQELAEKRARLEQLAEGRKVTITLKLRLFLSRAAGAGLTQAPPQRRGDVELQGAPAQVREAVRRYEEVGVEELVVVLPHEDERALESDIETFASEVAADFN